MTDAIICDLSAIPADQRDAHFALARSLLFADDRSVREVESGLAFDPVSYTHLTLPTIYSV